MPYTKTIWADGDIITAQKMNNIENGIEGLENQQGGSNTLIITHTGNEPQYTFAQTQTGLGVADLAQALFVYDTSYSHSACYPIYVGYSNDDVTYIEIDIQGAALYYNQNSGLVGYRD